MFYNNYGTRDVSEILTVEKYRDHEILVKGHSRYYSIDWVWFPGFLLVFYI